MYDAIVVGARCAGSPTAMLLSRKGYRVLLVDRATFPSDTVRLFFVQPPGVARLKRWGLLDRLAATGCPPIQYRTIDMDDFPLRGTAAPIDGVDLAYAPRRIVLDKILVDAAVEAGAELRERFSMDDLWMEDGQVVSIRGRGADGSPVAERARIVVGANGQYSKVARTVNAAAYDERPPPARQARIRTTVLVVWGEDTAPHYQQAEGDDVSTSRPRRRRPARSAATEESFPKTTRPEAEERRDPTPVLSSADLIGRNLDAVPDRVDARDYVYQPRLGALPDLLVNCAAVPEVLDQGQEGACTGFALAAVINFLLRQRGRGDERVSPRMLYEMARRYDEWPGEEYVGSSARGAMKGWVSHGVCSRKSWDDAQQGLEHLTTEVSVESMRTPGGAFYRVVHRDVRDMHAALVEVGILYITLMVHEGWGQPGPMMRTIEYQDSAGTKRALDLPVIQRRGRSDSGHAVAIVGYTHEGFIIQNSWGEGWGAGGFALLPYEDYLLHATDVWVAQLGVPVEIDLWRSGAADSTEGIQRAAPAVPLAEIRPFVVDVGNNGELSTAGQYWTTPADLERLFSELIPKATTGWAKKRVLLYLHGGLNEETAVARRIVGFRDVLLANEIYPLHIMWETGFVETINNIIQDVFTDTDDRAGDWLSRFREGLLEARDRTLELTVAAAGTAIWSEMKENAMLSSRHPDGIGAMQLLVKVALAAIGKLKGSARDEWELHVVGHSAGCIYASYAVSALCGLGVSFKSLQLMAPAIRIDEFKRAFLEPISAGNCPRPSLYILSDVGERDDSVGPYGKSLLYLVSNAFEGRRETPLLGMETFLTRDPDLNALFAGQVDGRPAVVVAGLDQGPGSVSRSSTHGGFDNDPDTLNSVLYRILDGPPPRPFTTRDLQF